MAQNAAFSRLKSLMAGINAVMASAAPYSNEAIASILGSYRSRGHGKGKTQAAPKHKHMAGVRAAKAKHNKAKRG